MKTLAELTPGMYGQVRRVQGADELSVRLMEMGLTPGVQVTVLGTAPLGDPMEIELRGYRLSVRKSEAARVELAND